MRWFRQWKRRRFEDAAMRYDYHPAHYFRAEKEKRVNADLKFKELTAQYQDLYSAYMAAKQNEEILRRAAQGNIGGNPV